MDNKKRQSKKFIEKFMRKNLDQKKTELKNFVEQLKKSKSGGSSSKTDEETFTKLKEKLKTSSKKNVKEFIQKYIKISQSDKKVKRGLSRLVRKLDKNKINFRQNNDNTILIYVLTFGLTVIIIGTIAFSREYNPIEDAIKEKNQRIKEKTAEKNQRIKEKKEDIKEQVIDDTLEDIKKNPEKSFIDTMLEKEQNLIDKDEEIKTINKDIEVLKNEKEMLENTIKNEKETIENTIENEKIENIVEADRDKAVVEKVAPEIQAKKIKRVQFDEKLNQTFCISRAFMRQVDIKDIGEACFEREYEDIQVVLEDGEEIIIKDKDAINDIKKLTRVQDDITAEEKLLEEAEIDFETEYPNLYNTFQDFKATFKGDFDLFCTEIQQSIEYKQDLQLFRSKKDAFRNREDNLKQEGEEILEKANPKVDETIVNQEKEAIQDKTGGDGLDGDGAELAEDLFESSGTADLLAAFADALVGFLIVGAFFIVLAAILYIDPNLFNQIADLIGDIPIIGPVLKPLLQNFFNELFLLNDEFGELLDVLGNGIATFFTNIGNCTAGNVGACEDIFPDLISSLNQFRSDLENDLEQFATFSVDSFDYLLTQIINITEYLFLQVVGSSFVNNLFNDTIDFLENETDAVVGCVGSGFQNTESCDNIVNNVVDYTEQVGDLISGEVNTIYNSTIGYITQLANTDANLIEGDINEFDSDIDSINSDIDNFFDSL